LEQLIRSAIVGKKLLEYDYDGFHRIVEPHVYGTHDGQYSILVYQVRGQSSSGGLPNWRRMLVNKITNMKILDESFPGRRPYPSGKHSSFDRTILVVS